MVRYRLAEEHELTQIAVLFDEAFKGYPLFSVMGSNNKSDEDFFYQLHLVNTKAYYRQHCCLVAVDGEQIVAAALLKHRDKPDVGLWNFVLAGGLKLLWSAGVSRIRNLLDVMDEAKHAFADLNTPYWYLESFAVAPQYQSQHLGSKMIADCILPYIAKNGGGDLTLITNTDSNRIFYTKRGFSEFGESVISRYGLEVGNWSFIIKV
ncbi:hypothetical protein A8L34_15270 [Bacillus sp. FJAT-27264]|uniref:GNAT family N-acetyltransferase n=1 Tax=Paenibacillus sp. (strain DSM 101736 / FJAT-27264) TaxID=1850362 RepID=UPI000807F059|nr:GNAT family N-acetyltransferase [Bacillus sp. FJAT-27264]OBZ11702.1 hypothetical protein A8L34_15270 [Bacillus sp. FJAT-27264]